MSESVTPKASSKTPITFKRGALHEQLGVAADEPIPAAKRDAALAGAYGELAAKRARFAYKGPLATGRKTAARHRLVSR